MFPRLIGTGIPAIAAVLGVTLCALWVRGYIVASPLPERDPGFTRPLPTAKKTTALPTNTALPATSSVVRPIPPVSSPVTTVTTPASAVTALPGSWPGFRGINHDNVCAENVPLLRGWDASGPRRLWSVEVGEGYAGVAVRNGRVYLLDYDQAAQADTLRCFSLADGTELWRNAYTVEVKRNHGMTRTVPAVTDDAVVTLGPKCHVLCTDAKTGKTRWQIDLVREYGTVVPEWYAGQCPLIDGDRVVLAPGGSALMLSVDLASGKVRWKAPNPAKWQMTHSSILPVTLEGEKMYVYCGSGGVAGISAKDGRILWQTTDWKIDTATVPTPVPVGEGRLFLTGGYDSGSMMLQIKKQGSAFQAQTLFRIPSTTFGSDQQTPIFYQGNIYGVTSGGQMVCLDLQGQPKWTSSPANRFGLGPYLIADGLLFALNDRGLLTVAEATPTAFRPLAKAQILDGHECWGPLALAGGRLIARDFTHLVCLDVARSGAPGR